MSFLVFGLIFWGVIVVAPPQLADSFTHELTEFRKPLGPEEQQHDGQNQHQFPNSKPEHGSRLMVITDVVVQRAISVNWSRRAPLTSTPTIATLTTS